jgi:hypothetical protein
MKILIAGNWKWPQYEPAFARALSELGHHVIPFSFSDYFKGRLGHYQSALPVPGWPLWNINSALLKCVRSSAPDILLVWRGTHVLSSTIDKIKQCGVLTASYNNDDPFGPKAHGGTPWHHRFLWTWYLKCLKSFDFNFVFRSVNVNEAISCGAKNVNVLKPYFLPWQEIPKALSAVEKKRYECDVVFVGHYEPDGRKEYLRSLVENGLHVRLFGEKYWTKAVLGDLSSYFGCVFPVYGEEYAKALFGAKMCLSFLSKMNRDTYTRRCFEIPALGRLLLCERTDDLREMFIDGKEAVFFSSNEELIEKALRLINHPDEIERIAEAGRKRVWTDGHDVRNRAAEFLSLITLV